MRKESSLNLETEILKKSVHPKNFPEDKPREFGGRQRRSMN